MPVNKRIAMRKVTTYLSALLTLVLLAGCQREILPGGDPLGGEDIPIHLRFSSDDDAPDTKASWVSGAESPVNTIHLLCFNQYGGFIKVCEPEVLDTEAKTLKTTVPGQTRSIHFIANHSASIPNSSVNWQESLIFKDSGLTSSNESQIAYWGYYHAADISTLKNELGDAGHPYMIYLLRDRAKIVLNSIKLDGSTEADKSKITWCLSNQLPRGYLAPKPPYAGYFEDGTGDLAGKHVASPSITLQPWQPTGAIPRHRAAISELESCETPLFLFEDENTPAYPVKIIMRVDYGGGEIRFHNILLMKDDYEQYTIIRGHVYEVSVTKLPKELGFNPADYGNDEALCFEAARDSELYSNNQAVQVNPVIPSVTNGTYKLDILEENTSIIYQTAGSKTVRFSFMQGDSPGAESASDFRVSWMEHDGHITSDKNLDVTYNASTGEGTVSFNLASVSSSLLKKGVILIQDKNHGLARFVRVYSITQFVVNPVLVQDGTRGTGTDNHPTYKLSFVLPDNYPVELYPVRVSMTSMSLSPYSDSEDSPAAAHGSFGVEVASTAVDGIVNGAGATDWNYDARKWGYWFIYDVGTPGLDPETDIPLESDRTVTLYLDDVRGKRGVAPTTVGLYLSLPYFGSSQAVTPAP